MSAKANIYKERIDVPSKTDDHENNPIKNKPDK